MDRTCEQCGKTFKAKRSDARLCGASCRQAASRAARGIKQGRKRARAATISMGATPAAHPSSRDTPGPGPRLTAIESRLAAIEGRLTVIDRVQASTSQKVTTMERQVGALETAATRIPGIETSAEALSGKVKEIRIGLKGVRADLAAEVNARQELATDMVAVSQQIAAFADAVTPGRRR